MSNSKRDIGVRVIEIGVRVIEIKVKKDRLSMWQFPELFLMFLPVTRYK